MAHGVFRRPPRLPPPSQASEILGVALAGPVNADLAATEPDDTLFASATLDVQAALATAEADDVASGSGTVDLVASLAVAEGDDGFAGTATLDIAATAGIAEANDVPSSSGAVDLVGSLAATEANDTVPSSATLGISATAAINEGNDRLDASALMPIFYPGRGGVDDREDYERWLRQWQGDLRRIIDQAWAIAAGLIDPVTLAPIQPADLERVAEALALVREARDAAAIDAIMADEARRQEEEALAVLLLAA